MRHPLAVIGLLSVIVSGCFCGGGPNQHRVANAESTITVANESSFVITEVLITQVNSATWGPNLLRDVLFPGEQITVEVACDTYDVLIADEYGRDCILGAVDLCFSNELWVIDNSTLRFCGF